MIKFKQNTSKPKREKNTIHLYSLEEFDKMMIVGQMTANILDQVKEIIQPGVTTQDIDTFILSKIKETKAVPAPLFYKGFPSCCCISVNHVVCHGIPGKKRLRHGDIINIDITLVLDGWHGDTSRTFPVGDVSTKIINLLRVTKECLDMAVEICKPGATTGDIGAIIQQHAEAHKYSVVQEFCGHGTGFLFHDEPNILHYGTQGTGIPLQPGMIFTIEPMINLGKAGVKVLPDGWTAVTRDKQYSAQFEHTIGITKNNPIIFTKY